MCMSEVPMTRPDPTSAKTERLHVLVEPKFKKYLHTEAKRQGVSVAELIRARFKRRHSEEEAMLAAATAELSAQVRAVKDDVRRTIREVDAILAELRQGRAAREAARDAAPSGEPDAAAHADEAQRATSEAGA